MRLIRDLSYDAQKMLARVYKKSKHHQTRERAKCLLLSFEGKRISELMEIFKVSRKTIHNWFTRWEDEKLLGLYDNKGRGRKTKLKEEQEKQVKEWVKESPKNLNKVQSRIEIEMGIKVSKDTIKRTIKKHDMRWKRIKRGLAKQPFWWELEIKLPEIEKLKDADKRGEIDLRYLDQVGWGTKAIIPYGWQEKNGQVIIKDVEGKRKNVMGIMNIRNELYYQQYETSITSEDVIEFLDNFSKNLKRRTVVLLDQASIHTSDKIMEKLEEWKENKLELFWLPVYSPKLNLIEILWRFMKYEWIEISAYESRKSLNLYITKVLELFGTEYVINFA
jgi:transposase